MQLRFDYPDAVYPVMTRVHAIKNGMKKEVVEAGLAQFFWVPPRRLSLLGFKPAAGGAQPRPAAGGTQPHAQPRATAAATPQYLKETTPPGTLRGDHGFSGKNYESNTQNC